MYSAFRPPRSPHQIVVTCSYRSAFLAARLMAVYAGFGLLSDAWRVFEPSPIDCFSNMLLWNSILRANVTNGYRETSGGGFAAGAVALIPN